MKFSLSSAALALLCASTGMASAQSLIAQPAAFRIASLPEAPQQQPSAEQTPPTDAQSAAPSAPVPEQFSSSQAPATLQNSGTPQTPAPSQNATPPPGASPAPTSQDKFKAEEQQRMLGVIPNFNTVNSEDAAPLTKGEKFHLWFKSSTDPFVFVTAGLDAGIEQAENDYSGYHQGFEGFAKRYGASYADTVDGNLWGNAILPVLLHQDPRYYRLGHGTVKYRLWWAALSTVRCKGDNGRWEPNYSNLGGNLIGGAISNIYYPSSDRGTGLIFERGFTVTAEGAIGSVAYEFYPDVAAYYRRRHQRHLLQKAALANPGPATTAP